MIGTYAISLSSVVILNKLADYQTVTNGLDQTILWRHPIFTASTGYFIEFIIFLKLIPLMYFTSNEDANFKWPWQVKS